MTLEDGHQDTDHKEQNHDTPGDSECYAKGAHDSKDAVVEENQRRLDGDGGTEIKHLNGEEDLVLPCQRPTSFPSTASAGAYFVEEGKFRYGHRAPVSQCVTTRSSI